MTLAEFENLTVSQLERLDIESLKKIASEQGRKLNKRLDRISSSRETNKSAVKAVQKSGGRFGVRGLTVKNMKGDINIGATKKNLITEIKREQNFQRAKTSTYRGAKKVQEESEKKTVGITSKEYSKKKESSYRKEEKARLEKKQGHKITKAQKKRIEKESKRIAQKAKKDFDKRTGEAWEKFHKWKETHPVTAQSYSKEKVKSIVNEYSIEGVNSPDYEGLLLANHEDNSKVPDIWQTVDRGTPFDVGETPEQFTLVNGRIRK